MTKRVSKKNLAAPEDTAAAAAKKSAPKRKNSRPSPKKKAASPAAPEDSATLPTAAPDPDLSHITPDLRPLSVPIDDLIKDSRNARTHDTTSITAILASLREYGQRKPIVVNRRNKKIEAGHGTVMALQKMQRTHVAAVFVDDDDLTHYGFSIADNRSGELSYWNQEALESLLTEYQLVEQEGTLWEDLLLDELKAGENVSNRANGGASGDPQAQIEVEHEYSVIVECEGEADQREVYELMKSQGRRCRVLTI